MGVWGMGVYESDNAAEFLDKVIAETVTKARNLFSLATSKDFLHYGEHGLIPAIDIVITLSSHYGTWVGLELEEAKQWKEQYLSHFDKEMISQYMPPNYAERRQIVIERLDKLIELAQYWESL